MYKHDFQSENYLAVMTKTNSMNFNAVHYRRHRRSKYACFSFETSTRSILFLTLQAIT